MNNFLTRETLAQKLSCCDRTVDRLIREGVIPKPFRLGDRPRWIESEIDAWASKLSEEANDDGTETEVD